MLHVRVDSFFILRRTFFCSLSRVLSLSLSLAFDLSWWTWVIPKACKQHCCNDNDATMKTMMMTIIMMQKWAKFSKCTWISTSTAILSSSFSVHLLFYHQKIAQPFNWPFNVNYFRSFFFLLSRTQCTQYHLFLTVVVNFPISFLYVCWRLIPSSFGFALSSIKNGFCLNTL